MEGDHLLFGKEILDSIGGIRIVKDNFTTLQLAILTGNFGFDGSFTIQLLEVMGCIFNLSGMELKLAEVVKLK